MSELLDDFRPVGGVGNNLDNPSLNALTGNAELRIGPANFAPGTTNGLVDGPNPRTVSNVVSSGPNALIPDESASAWLYVFGQFVDHDLSLEAVGKVPTTTDDASGMDQSALEVDNVNTNDISIPIPPGDPDLAATKISMTRAITDPKTGTVNNTVAANLDLSQVYGSDAATVASLRNADGTMKTTDDGHALSTAESPMGLAFVAGDVRVMENPELTAVTTLFVEEHNLWVAKLSAEHPDWTGDQLYNQAKAITTAEYQHIVYNEFLPSMIGKDAIPGYTGYDSSVNPQITQEFSASAFRVGHSQVSGEQAAMNNNGVETFVQSLADSFFNTPQQTIDNDMNALMRNLSSEVSQATDVYAVDELRNLLSASPAQMDLIAIDIQRERDLGIGTLNQTREALGLTPYKSFAELTDDPVVAANLKSQFGSIDKVDLLMGGLAEKHVGGASGETFQAIIAKQFIALRDGDRYYYENQDFDPETTKIISKTTLGDILQRNTGTPAEQKDVFVAAQRHASDVEAEDPDKPQLVMGVDKDGATVAGGVADDTIVAGHGIHQVLTGGGGHDVFQFNGTGYRGDHISDWNKDDVIQFRPDGDSLASLGKNVTVTLQDINAGTLVRYGGNSIILDGVKAATLTTENFDYPAGSDVTLSTGSDKAYGWNAGHTSG